jgi:hypothetical protein
MYVQKLNRWRSSFHTIEKKHLLLIRASAFLAVLNSLFSIASITLLRLQYHRYHSHLIKTMTRLLELILKYFK